MVQSCKFGAKPLHPRDLTLYRIYCTRWALTSYYDYRISNTEVYLKKLNKDRDATIERLKEATKYNSTQQLLEKYGASPKQKEPAATSPGRKKQQKPIEPQGPRTGIAPPPTANIQRSPTQQQQPPVPPQRLNTNPSSPKGPPAPQQLPSPESAGAEFAPNAFGPADLANQYSATPPATVTQTHWYDRILDALLGEDETQAKNRFALICSSCRLVNGQAPPGARTLEDVGRWRCGGCSAWNGKEKPKQDVEELVKGWEAERKAKVSQSRLAHDGGIDSDNRETEDDSAVVIPTAADESSGVDVAAESAEDTPPPSRSTRSKSKGKGKK